MKRSAEDDDKPRSGARKSLQRTVASLQAESADGEPGETHEPETPSSEPQHARLNAGAATNGNDEQTTAAGQEPAAAALFYPNPRNFVERLMLVLETNSAPDTIWWIEDGKAVALNIDNLKEGTVLRDHFRGIKYKFFIRNFSRWGFRRNTDFSVPYGQFHYRNSLFQRDRPNLVAHMRRDSDVQDIFAEHEAETEEMKSSSAAESSQQNTSSSSLAAAPAGTSETPQEQQAPPAPEDAANWNTALLQQLVGLLVEQNTSQQGQLPGNLNPDVAQLPPQQQPENIASPALERAIGQHHQNPENTTGGLNDHQNRLLLAIVHLSNQFLSVPANQSVADDFVLRSVVQAVEEVGQRRLTHEPPPPGSALVQQLLRNLAGATTSTVPHQVGGIHEGGAAPQVGPSQNPSRRPDDNNNISETAKLILEALPQQFVQGSGGPQQQPQQGQGNLPNLTLDNETAARLQEYLMSLVQQAPQGQDTIAVTPGGPSINAAAQHPNQQVSSAVPPPQPPVLDPTAFVQELLFAVVRQWSSHHHQQQLEQARTQVPEQEQQPDARHSENKPSSR